MKREDQYWTTKDGIEFLRDRMSEKFRDQLRELENLREDIRKAQEYIIKCKQRYLKDKLKKRTMADAVNEDPFKELEEWETRESIRDAYGYEMITEEQLDHLMNLWELREEQKRKNKGKAEYEDDITIALDWALSHLHGAFKDKIAELEETEAIVQRDVNQIVYKHNEEVRKRWS